MSNGFDPMAILGVAMRIREQRAQQEQQAKDEAFRLQQTQEQKYDQYAEIIKLGGAIKDVETAAAGELGPQHLARLRILATVKKQDEARAKEAQSYSQFGPAVAGGLSAAFQAMRDQPTPENQQAFADMLPQVLSQFGDYTGPLVTAAIAGGETERGGRINREIELGQNRRSALAQASGLQDIQGRAERTNIFEPNKGIATFVGRPQIEEAIRKGGVEVGGMSGLSGLTADEAGLTRSTRANFEQKIEAMNAEQYNLQLIAGAFVPEFATYPGAMKGWAYRVGSKLSPEKMMEIDPDAAQWLAQYDQWEAGTTEALLTRVKAQSGAAYAFKELQMMTKAYLNKDLDPFTFAARLDRLMRGNEYHMARINLALKNGVVTPDEALFALDDSPQGAKVRDKIAAKYPLISPLASTKTVDLIVRDRQQELTTKYLRDMPNLTEDQIADLVADDMQREFFSVPAALRGK
jgi:hypothetical protein